VGHLIKCGIAIIISMRDVALRKAECILNRIVQVSKGETSYSKAVPSDLDAFASLQSVIYQIGIHVDSTLHQLEQNERVQTEMHDQLDEVVGALERYRLLLEDLPRTVRDLAIEEGMSPPKNVEDVGMMVSRLAHMLREESSKRESEMKLRLTAEASLMKNLGSLRDVEDLQTKLPRLRNEILGLEHRRRESETKVLFSYDTQHISYITSDM
jgi:hypothetical protein